MNEEVEREVEDIADRTRVVPVTMILAVLVTLTLFTVIVFAVYRDSDEGSLHDDDGIVNEETVDSMDQVSPVE